MNQKDLGQAIGFTATISLIFMLCFIFQITKSPFFFLLASLMSLGYTLCLLALFQERKSSKFYIYFFIGLFFIFLCVALSLAMPHEHSFFV